MRRVERLEFEHRAVAPRRGPCRARVEQLGTREADDQDRGSAGQRGNVVDQVEQRRLGPVNVLDDQDQWTVDGEPLEQPAHRPRRLLDRDGGSQHGANRLLIAVEQRFDLPVERAHDVGERLIRRALAVGQTAARQQRRVAERGRELGAQARLADPRGAHDGDEAARTLGARLRVGRVEPRELRHAAHEWGRRHLKRGRLTQLEQHARVDGGVGGERPGNGIAEPDRAVRGLLGQPAGGGDRGARDRVRAARSRTDEDLAELYPDPKPGGAQLDRGTSGPLRVVAMRLGQAEHADQAIAEIQLDAAAMPFDHVAAPVERAVQRFRVRNIRAHGQDRHDAACLEPSRHEGSVRPHRRQGLGDVRRRRALVRRLGEQLADQPLERRRSVDGIGDRRQMLPEHLRGLARERRTPGRQLMERNAERVDVARRPDLVTPDLLRGQVADRAEDEPFGRDPVGAEFVGDAEVAQRGAAVGRQPDVAGLHIAVDHAVRVRVGERDGDVAADPKRGRERRAAAIEPLGQGPAAHRAQHEIRDAVDLARVVDGDHIRVVAEPAGDPGLALEARALATEYECERDLTIQALVVREVHLLGRAVPEPAADVVAPGDHACGSRRRRGEGGGVARLVHGWAPGAAYSRARPTARIDLTSPRAAARSPRSGTPRWSSGRGERPCRRRTGSRCRCSCCRRSSRSGSTTRAC